MAGYLRVIELRPQTAQAYCGAGRVALHRGDLDAAITYLEAAIRIAPDYGTAYYALGRTLRKQGRVEEARQHLELSELRLDVEPPLDDSLSAAVETLRIGAIEALGRGIDLAQQGRFEPAVVLFKEALRINPELAEAHAQIGAAYLAGNEIDQSETHLRRALELDPGLADAHYNLGLAAHRRREYSQAVTHFENAVEIRAGHYNARLGLGTDLPRLGRGSEAVTHLRVALDLRPDDPRPYDRLAQALAEVGRLDDAVELARQGLELARTQGRLELAADIEARLRLYSSAP
jgi:tetratricopeptide (TPR) repeat protein